MEDPNICYIPIGDLLNEARDALPGTTGTLIHNEAFSLFEAMSAVEIGNIKMDTGMLATPKTIDELIADGAAPSELSVDQVLQIVDRLIALEATWYNGGALASTVFSCLYMLRPERIQSNAALYAYCTALKDTCSAVRALVMQGGVAEEEDFNIHCFGLPIDEGVGVSSKQEDKVLPLLSKALDLCEEMAASEQQAGRAREAELHAALSLRLQLRRELYMGLTASLKIGSPDLEAAQKHFTKALASLDAMPQGHTQEAEPPAQASSDSSSSVVGFDDNVNRHLLAPAPPRAIKVFGLCEARSHMRTTLDHLLQALQVQQCADLGSLLSWAQSFSLLRPSTLPRSLAHMLLLPRTWGLPDPGSTDPPKPAPSSTSSSGTKAPPTPPAWMLTRDMVRESCALEPFAHGKLGPDVEMFLEQSVIALGNWVQALLMNPCRLRRRLRRGLEDWGNLYQHALNADTSDQFQAYMRKVGWQWVPMDGEGGQDPQGPLATWVERYTASTMLSHLLLGFELELYEAKEYNMIYWYISMLYMSQRTALQQLQSTLPARTQSKKIANKKAEQQQAASAAQQTYQRRQQALLAETLQAELSHYLCQGMVRVMLALKAAGIQSDPDPPFNGLAQRFDQRFAAFHNLVVRPEPVVFETYAASVNIGSHTPESVLQLATDAFGMARKVIKFLQTSSQMAAVPASVQVELKALDRVAAQNMLASTVLVRSLQQEPGNLPKVAFDFQHHRHYPTLAVKTKGN